MCEDLQYKKIWTDTSKMYRSNSVWRARTHSEVTRTKNTHRHTPINPGVHNKFTVIRAMGGVEKRAIVCLKCLKFNTQNNVVLLSEISFGSCTNHHWSHMHMSDG